MSEDDELDRAVGDLFDRYFRYDQTLHDSKVLDALLPDNSTVVRSLGERCLDEARKRLRRTSYRGTASRDYRAATAKAGGQGEVLTAWTIPRISTHGFRWAALGRARGRSEPAGHN
jgi:hypothetical protein